ncbi:MAG TPA: hypothetical protein VOA41_07540 [Candidatus Dormibacteraeota bacterium]|nr:hypothetical protein [Candidatus Dormibacteraeota bacterium]
MSTLKALVAVGVLAAFLAGAVVTNYIHPQPTAAMTAPAAQSQMYQAEQPQMYQAEQARYVNRAPAVRYISERAPVERRVSERYIPVRERDAVIHRKRTLKKEALIVGGSAAAGAAIGAAAHGGRGAAVGALAGGIAGLAYDLATRNR